MCTQVQPVPTTAGASTAVASNAIDMIRIAIPLVPERKNGRPDCGPACRVALNAP